MFLSLRPYKVVACFDEAISDVIAQAAAAAEPDVQQMEEDAKVGAYHNWP